MDITVTLPEETWKELVQFLAEHRPSYVGLINKISQQMYPIVPTSPTGIASRFRPGIVNVRFR